MVPVIICPSLPVIIGPLLLMIIGPSVPMIIQPLLPMIQLNIPVKTRPKHVFWIGNEEDTAVLQSAKSADDYLPMVI